MKCHATFILIWIKDLSDPFMARRFDALQFPLVTKVCQNPLGNEWSAEGGGVYYITEDYKDHHKGCCQWKECCINVLSAQNQAALVTIQILVSPIPYIVFIV